MDTPSLIERSAGILLHPTSLPGPYGIGDLGPGAYAWVDFLKSANQKWWQFLPLGPTGYADSPYQCFSAFAGNPYLVSPELLHEEGLLSSEEAAPPTFPEDHVDYGPVIFYKVQLLTRAFERFESGNARQLREPFARFCEEHKDWLEDYALFMALKDAHNLASWLTWEEELVMRQPQALEKARNQYAQDIRRHRFFQFLFFHQWENLRSYAHENGVSLIGDMPIFISSDSADIWAFPQGFLVDEHRHPTFVAGVPPDYFSKTGQLWGNPLYDWEQHKKNGYSWWKKRLSATLKMVDLVRIDHFRGFEAHWEIPAGNPTAEHGRWVKGPGTDLFDNLLAGMDSLPIIAEDLGVITPEVDALRLRYNFPGMRVLQFAFGGGVESRFLPHNYEEQNTIVYTGTHDNDTSRGFYDKASEYEKDFMRRYMAVSGQDIAWDLIRLAHASVANLAVAPLQDVLSLGTEARMNLPGVVGGNWGWRFHSWQLDDFVTARLADLTQLYGRANPQPE
ncbi:MAG TPA: 4-alpha-glucanotransferase [Thermotogota bacterium]|nr:4-alpha-glucanotransferase [Thermotogota bacterium]HRW93463.1 4-alpha-glucanotransferase [Thermotogota bacterium]